MVIHVLNVSRADAGKKYLGMVDFVIDLGQYDEGLDVTRRYFDEKEKAKGTRDADCWKSFTICKVDAPARIRTRAQLKRSRDGQNFIACDWINWDRRCDVGDEGAALLKLPASATAAADAPSPRQVEPGADLHVDFEELSDVDLDPVDTH